MPDHEDVPDQEARTPDPRNRDAGSSKWMLVFLCGMLAGGLVTIVFQALWSAYF